MPLNNKNKLFHPTPVSSPRDDRTPVHRPPTGMQLLPSSPYVTNNYKNMSFGKALELFERRWLNVNEAKLPAKTKTTSRGGKKMRRTRIRKTYKMRTW